MNSIRQFFASRDRLGKAFGLTSALLFLCFVFRGTIFDPDRIYLYRDFWVGLLPQRYLWTKTLLTEGQLPLWNSFIFGGNVFAADIKSAVYYPLNLIFLLFPLKKFALAFSWYIFAHHILMFIGMYLLLRQLQHHVFAAILFGLAYSISGLSISSSNLANTHAFLFILPFFVYFLIRLKSDAQLLSINTFGLVCAMALPFYSSAADLGILLIPAFLLLTARRFFNRHFLALWVAIPILTLLLSAAQLLPGVNHWSTVRKDIAMSERPRKITEASTHPLRLIDFFIPLPFGNFDRQQGYRAMPLIDTPNKTPLYFSFYLGAVFLLVSLIGFWCGRPPFGLAIGTAVIVWLAMGRYAFFDIYSVLYQYLPGFKLVRMPEKHLIWVSFLFFLWFCHASRLLLDKKDLLKNHLYRFVVLLLLALLVAVTLLMISGTEYLYKELIDARAVRHAIFINIALMVLLLSLRFSVIHKFRWPLFAILILPDLYTNAMSLHWHQPTELMHQPMPGQIKISLRQRREQIEAGAAFRYSGLPIADLVLFEEKAVDSTVNAAGLGAVLGISKLRPSSGVLYGITHASGSGVVYENEKLAFVRILFNRDPRRFYNLYSVYYVGVAPNEEIPFYHARENHEALPYAFFPETIRFHISLKEVLDTVFHEGFDEKLQVLAYSTREPETIRQESAVVQVNKIDNASIDFTVRSATGAALKYLQVNESFNEHWQARIEGSDALLTIDRGNYWAMLIDLENSLCGNGCTIQLRYRNPYLRWGLALTVLTLVLFLLAIFTRQYKVAIVNKH